MKKVCCVLVLLTAMLLLAGCAGQEKAGDSAGKAALSLLEAVHQAASDAEGLVTLTAEDLTDIMGIEPEEYQEAVYLQSADMSGREIVAFRAKDAEAAKRITQRLETYLEQRRKEARDYLPDAYRLLTDARVESKRLTVALFVGAKASDESTKFLAGE